MECDCGVVRLLPSSLGVNCAANLATCWYYSWSWFAESSARNLEGGGWNPAPTKVSFCPLVFQHACFKEYHNLFPRTSFEGVIISARLNSMEKLSMWAWKKHAECAVSLAEQVWVGGFASREGLLAAPPEVWAENVVENRTVKMPVTWLAKALSVSNSRSCT